MRFDPTNIRMTEKGDFSKISFAGSVAPQSSKSPNHEEL
jgi:hypothetical protein